MKTIELYFPNNVSYFKVGEKLNRNGKETKIKVIKISAIFPRVKISLSDKTSIIYWGIPFSLTK